MGEIMSDKPSIVELQKERSRWPDDWKADIDDPGTDHEMWTGKWYAGSHTVEVSDADRSAALARYVPSGLSLNDLCADLELSDAQRVARRLQREFNNRHWRRKNVHGVPDDDRWAFFSVVAEELAGP